MSTINQRNIAKSIFLTIITLGVYGIYWQYLLIKNTKAVQKDKSSSKFELICYFLLGYIYIPIWWIIEGIFTNKALSKYGISGNAKKYIVFGVLSTIPVLSAAFHIVAMAMMQHDFNKLDHPDFTISECDTAAKAFVAKIPGYVAVYLFLGVMALIVLFPFYFMLASSLKSLEEYRLSVPTLIPEAWKYTNYTDILIPFEWAQANGLVGTLVSPEAASNDFDLFTLFRNTMYVGIVSTIFSVVITVLSAFAFARLNFKGKNALFAALLGTMMIPGELFTITNYATVMTKGGWFPTFFNGLGNMFGWFGPDFQIPMVDSSYAALIIPFLVSVFYIYLLRQNFMQIPNELYLAAKVDGTGDFKYLCKVMIPLSLPTIISITILKMMGAWNSYMWPRLVANDDAHRLITNGLRNAFNDVSGNTDYPRQMAAVALVSLPLFLVFVFLRKYIMKGVSRSGIKG